MTLSSEVAETEEIYCKKRETRIESGRIVCPAKSIYNILHLLSSSGKKELFSPDVHILLSSLVPREGEGGDCKAGSRPREETAHQLLFLHSSKSSLESNLPVCYCIHYPGSRTLFPSTLRIRIPLTVVAGQIVVHAHVIMTKFCSNPFSPFYFLSFWDAHRRIASR